MITVQELVQDAWKEGWKEGWRQGWQEGLLTDYVRLGWGDAAAAAFQMQLADAPLAQLPTLAELRSRLQRQEPPLPPDNDANCRAD